GDLLASASADHTIKLWDPATGQHRHTLAGHSNWVTAVCFDPRGEWLASVGHDGCVFAWDMAGRRRGVAETDAGYATVTSACVAPDGGLLAWGGYNGDVWLSSPRRRGGPTTLPGGDLVFCVRFAPD